MRRCRGLAALCIAALLGVHGSARAQQAPAAAWARLQTAATAEAALDRAERTAPPDQLASAGRAYAAACERAWGEAALETARCRVRAAEAVFDNQETGAAREMLEAAVVRLEAAGALAELDLARARSALSDVLPNAAENSPALAALRAALAVQERRLSDAHIDTFRTLRRLGSRFNENGAFDEAEAVLRRARTAAATAQIPTLDLARLASFEGRNARDLGRYEEAEQKLEGSLAQMDDVMGRYDHRRDWPLSSLVVLYRTLGRNDEAEAAARFMLEIDERAFGPLDSRLANALTSVATTLPRQRAEEAAALQARAVELLTLRLGPRHWRTARGLSNLGALRFEAGRREEAEALLRQAIEITTEQLGPDHPGLADSLYWLAVVRRHAGGLNEAAALSRRAFDILTASYGAVHPLTLRSGREMARIALATGDGASAAATISANAEAAANALGADSVDAGLARAFHARALFALGRRDEAAVAARAGMAGVRRARPRERRDALIAIADVAVTRANTDAVAADLAFEALQWALAPETADAAVRAAARLAPSDPQIAALANRQRAGAARIEALERRMATAYSTRDDARIAQASAALRAEHASLAEAERDLRVRYPGFAELSSQAVVRIGDLNAASGGVLHRGEGVLQLLQAPDRLYVALITSRGSRFHVIDLPSEQAEALATRLRRTVSLERAVAASDLPDFDLEAAHELYLKVVAPLMRDARDLDALYVVPDGPLSAVPFSLLATRPAPRHLDRYERYRRTRFLSDDLALATLPSPAALVVARRHARGSRARENLLAFADPALGGDEDVRTLTQWVQLRRGVEGASDGARNAAAVCRMRPLPAARREALALALQLGAQLGDVYLGRAASERSVFALDASGALAQRRVLLFATHGLVAGEMAGVVEPALVLTPAEGCAPATETEDGLLTASEIATLTLDAEWVILSGCNTAATDSRPGAAPLSGLARAFLHAGARRLLVSHWSVDSEAAADLTAALFDPRNSDLAPAMALQAAMRTMRESGGAQSYRSHPAFWAPFVLVGDGR